MPRRTSSSTRKPWCTDCSDCHRCWGNNDDGRGGGTILHEADSTMPGSAAASSFAEAISSSARRRFPIGAEYVGDGVTHMRVWAPAANRVEVVVDSSEPPRRSTVKARVFQRLGQRQRRSVLSVSSRYGGPPAAGSRHRAFSPMDHTARPESSTPLGFNGLTSTGAGRRSKARLSTKSMSARSAAPGHGPRRRRN